MRNVLRLALVLSLALSTIVCSRDPQVAAREYAANGDAYMAKGMTKEAILEYRNAVKSLPRWADVHYKLARAYTAANDPEHAYESYARTADLDPKQIDAHINAGTLLLVAGEYKQAKAVAERALQADPRSADAHILLGNVLVRLNDSARATRQIEEAIHLDPTYAPAWTAMGAVRFNAGQRDQAGAAFRRAVKLAPRSTDARIALANYHWATGEVGNAESTLQDTLTIDRSNRDAHRALALLYLTSGRVSDAEPHFKALAGDPGGKLALADFYLGTKQPDAARSVLNDVARGDNKTERRAAQLRVASLEYASGRKETAQHVVDSLLTEQPRDVAARTFKARMLLEQGKTAEATTHAREAVKADAGSPEAHYTLALTAFARDDAEEARRELEKVVELSPHAAVAQAQLARVALSEGDAARALSAAEKAAEIAPRDPTVTVALARSLRAQGDLARAQRELATQIGREPNVAALRSELGWVLLERRDVAGARQSFEQALRLDSNATDARAGLVSADLTEGKKAQAQAQVDKWLAASPNDVTLKILAARTAMVSGRSDDGERLLRDVVTADPARLEAYDLLGRLYVSRGDMDRAMAEYRALANRSSSSAAGPRTMVGMINEARGRRDAAVEEYEQVLAANPRAGVAANNLAWIRAEEGRLDEAVRLANVATDVMRDRPEPYDTLGWIYYQQGQPARALSAFERALSHAPDNPTYHYHLGLTYLKLGDAARARAALNRAIELKPDSAPAADARKVLHERFTEGSSR
jgi:Tfp pilus assembly protein PilF